MSTRKKSFITSADESPEGSSTNFETPQKQSSSKRGDLDSSVGSLKASSSRRRTNNRARGDKALFDAASFMNEDMTPTSVLAELAAQDEEAKAAKPQDSGLSGKLFANLFAWGSSANTVGSGNEQQEQVAKEDSSLEPPSASDFLGAVGASAGVSLQLPDLSPPRRVIDPHAAAKKRRLEFLAKLKDQEAAQREAQKKKLKRQREEEMKQLAVSATGASSARRRSKKRAAAVAAGEEEEEEREEEELRIREEQRKRQQTVVIPKNPDHVIRPVGTRWNKIDPALNQRNELLGRITDDVLKTRMRH